MTRTLGDHVRVAPAPRSLRSTTARSTPGAPTSRAAQRGRSLPWPGAAIGVLAIVATLLIVGLVFTLSASSSLSMRNGGGPYGIFARQGAWVVLGLVAMLVTASVPHATWERLRIVLCGSAVLGLLLVLTPLGLARSGSRRWIGPEAIAVQPSEFAKLGLLVLVSSVLSQRAHLVRDPRRALRPALVWAFLTVVPVLLQPDMGTAFVLCVIVVSLLHAAAVPIRQLLFTSAVLLGGGYLYAHSASYRWERVVSFLDRSDTGGLGYHLHQSLIGLGSGRLTGLGVGASRAKWGFLPNAHTDFIFSVIGEEIGLVGALFVVLAFCALAVLGVHVSRTAPDRFGSLLATGITTWIVAQALVNIGAVLGLLPITGVPLPLVSVGGSSLVVNLAALGILVSVARASRLGPRPRIVEASSDGAVGHGPVRHSPVRHSPVRHSEVRPDAVRHRAVRHDAVRGGAVRPSEAAPMLRRSGGVTATDEPQRHSSSRHLHLVADPGPAEHVTHDDHAGRGNRVEPRMRSVAGNAPARVRAPRRPT